MSNQSIIEHKANMFYVEFREDYLAICLQCTYKKPVKGKEKSKASPYCKALILAISESWTNEKRGKGADLSFYMTYPQWIESMYGMFGRNVVIDSVDELIGEGLLSREPIKYKGKDTFRYTLNHAEINRHMKDLPERAPYNTHPQVNALISKRDDKSTGLQVNGKAFTNQPDTSLQVNGYPFTKGRNIESTNHPDIDSAQNTEEGTLPHDHDADTGAIAPTPADHIAIDTLTHEHSHQVEKQPVEPSPSDSQGHSHQQSVTDSAGYEKDDEDTVKTPVVKRDAQQLSTLQASSAPESAKVEPKALAYPPADAQWKTTTCLQLFTYWREKPLLSKYQNQQASHCAKGLAQNYTREQVEAVRKYMVEDDPWWSQRPEKVDVCSVAEHIHEKLGEMERAAAKKTRKQGNGHVTVPKDAGTVLWWDQQTGKQRMMTYAEADENGWEGGFGEFIQHTQYGRTATL